MRLFYCPRTAPDSSTNLSTPTCSAEGTITDIDIIPQSDSATCPGGMANVGELMARLRRGETYANVHTLAHPGGEMRGQIRVAGPRGR